MENLNQNPPKSSSRIFIGKLGAATKADLFKVCATHGNILDFLMKEQYAFVEYANEIEAQEAIKEMDGMFFNGQRIIAEFAKPKNNDDGYFQTHPRIYVGRLNGGGIKRKELLEMFAKYGEIVDILMKEEFAFIEYIKPESANNAIKELNGKYINNVRIVVEEARPRTEEGGLATPRLYVGHLTSSVKKSDIYFLFHKFGDIVEIMMKDDYAFVEYGNIHSASRAYTEMNGYRLGGQKLQVEEAKPKEGETHVPLKNISNTSNNTMSNFDKMYSKPKRKIRGSPRRSMSRSRSRSRSFEKELRGC